VYRILGNSPYATTQPRKPYMQGHFHMQRTGAIRDELPLYGVLGNQTSARSLGAFRSGQFLDRVEV
jgi:hypothetical protein